MPVVSNLLSTMTHLNFHDRNDLLGRLGSSSASRQARNPLYRPQNGLKKPQNATSSFWKQTGNSFQSFLQAIPRYAEDSRISCWPGATQKSLSILLVSNSAYGSDSEPNQSKVGRAHILKQYFNFLPSGNPGNSGALS